MNGTLEGMISMKGYIPSVRQVERKTTGGKLG
jgi:hypothetical protein